jgi:hypothetical protein
MITNPWINRAASLFLLLAVYCVGHDNGRQAQAAAMINQPICHQELRP